jgi:hypothetical protein
MQNSLFGSDHTAFRQSSFFAAIKNLKIVEKHFLSASNKLARFSLVHLQYSSLTLVSMVLNLPLLDQSSL